MANGSRITGRWSVCNIVDNGVKTGEGELSNIGDTDELKFMSVGVT